MPDTCTVCPRTLLPDEAHRPVCNVCEHRMRGWLTEIEHHQPLLAASLHRYRRGDVITYSHGAGYAHAPAPAREDVLNFLGPAAPGTVHALTPDDQTGPVPLAGRIHAWAEQLAEDRGEPLPPVRPGTLYTGYLAAHLPYALQRPWYPHMDTEIKDVVHRCRNITRTEPRRTWLTAPCPGLDCRKFELVHEDWQQYIICQACGRLLTDEEYNTHYATVMPSLYRTALQITLRERLSAMTTETARVRCILTIGDQVEITADAPPAERGEPVRYPAAEIAAAVGADVRDLPGMVLLADVDDRDRLTNWRRA